MYRKYIRYDKISHKFISAALFFRYMAPTAILVQYPTTTTGINSTTNNNPSVGVFPQKSSTLSSNSYRFGVYQLTTVGTSDATIISLVLVLISISFYRKALIAKCFLCQIIDYADSSFISISYVVSTVASYFDMSTAMNEWEV